jgi:hypothetical protein
MAAYPDLADERIQASRFDVRGKAALVSAEAE